jgi:hypothetical protein
VPTLPTPIQHTLLEFLLSAIRGIRDKRDTDRKEEIKLHLFTDDMILYLKDPKNS